MASRFEFDIVEGAYQSSFSRPVSVTKNNVRIVCFGITDEEEYVVELLYPKERTAKPNCECMPAVVPHEYFTETVRCCDGCCDSSPELTLNKANPTAVVKGYEGFLIRVYKTKGALGHSGVIAYSMF